MSIAHGLLKEEALNHPRKRSPFNASPVPYPRQQIIGTDGQSDGPEHSIAQERSRKDRNTSNTWTDSSLGIEVDDEEDRTEFVNEYNRLAEKHSVRKIVPDGYESVDVDTVTVIGKHGSWIMRKLLRRTSSMQTLKVKTDKQIRHKRSISDFSTRLRIRKEPLKDKPLKELVDICGRSLLYLPSEYAAASLSLPTCLRAAAHHIIQHGITTRGIFRIPGSNSSTLTLYNYYATVDECIGAICGTVRAPTLPEHLNYDVHDVASVFKKFLSGLPGGILQGSINIFEALVAIQSHLNSDPEWTRTKQSKLRARLIALSIGSVRSRMQRELICAVFGLLCMIGRAAELAPREDDRGRPLPTSGLMGYGALGVIFGPLLLGEALDSYDMRFTPDGLIVFPVAPSILVPKEQSKIATIRRKNLDEFSYSASRFDKIKVANGIAEMLITHWRDVVRHMRSLSILKTTGDLDQGLNRARKISQLRPYASEQFTLRKPPEWGAEGSSIRRVQRTPSPVTPLQRYKTQSEPGPSNQYNDSLRIRTHRCRPMPSTAPILSGSKSMGALSPMVEEPTVEDQGEKIPSESLFPQPFQVSRLSLGNRLPSNPALREAVKQLKTPPIKEEDTVALTEASSLLAEVARELRDDAQKLLGTPPDAASKVPIAELPSLPNGETMQGSKPLEKPSKQDLPNHSEETVLEGPNKNLPQSGIQTLGESIKEGSSSGEDQYHKLIVENASLAQLVQKQPPKSNARSFFEKINQALTMSTISRGFQDQVSPGKTILLSDENALGKIEKLVVVPATVETSLMAAPKQIEGFPIAKLTSQNQARQYFERADRERASVSAGREKREVILSDKPSMTSPYLRNASTMASKSPATQEELRRKSYTLTRFHTTRSQSPLRSEVRRPSTPETINQLDLESQVQIENSSRPANTPRGEVAKSIEMFSQTPSPLPRLENPNQHENPTRTADIQQPLERPQIPLRKPQGLVASRIRTLVASDPGSKKDHQPLAAPNNIQALATAEKCKSDNESTKSAAFLLKDVLERGSQDLNQLSVLADPVQEETQEETQEGPQTRTTHPNYKSGESPLSSAITQTPVTSSKGSADQKEELVSAHENGMPNIKGQAQNGATKENPESPGLRTNRDSDNQKSDASNITVILLPKKIAHPSERPISVSQRSARSDSSIRTIICSPKLGVQVSNEQPSTAIDKRFNGVNNTSGGNAALSPRQTAPQTPSFEVPQNIDESMSDVQTPLKRPPTRVVRGATGSVRALAAKFNNAEQTSPTRSPIRGEKSQGIIRNSLLQPADRLVSNYTTNSPPLGKLTLSERSDIRTIRNPLPVDRRPDVQSRRTPQKEISPLYRTPRNDGVKESESPSPFSFTKTPSVSTKRRSAFDGNDSLASPDTRTSGPRRPSHRLLHNHSPSIRKSLGSRTSSVGTILPHPVEPPIDPHVPFIRPPSTPRRTARDHVTFRVTTPSGNAALYEQIRKLQKQLESTVEELAQYKRLVESRGNLQDLGTLSEQLRESKREARSWKARAELAERRLAILEKLKGKTEYGHGDGIRDGEDDEFSFDASTMAVFNENKSRNGAQGKPRVIDQATEYATQSTDTEIWVRGGTATIIRGGDGHGRGSLLKERRNHNYGSRGGEKVGMGSVIVGIPSACKSDSAVFLDSSLKESESGDGDGDGTSMGGGDGTFSSWDFDAMKARGGMNGGKAGRVGVGVDFGWKGANS